MRNTMPTETTFGLAAGLKSGLFAAVIAAGVSLLAILVGFTIVPLTPGKEHIDAVRRLGAGLLCSFTLGPLAAFKVLQWFPELMAPWQAILAGEHILWIYLAASTPFIAVSAVLGFWIVAAVMRYFTRRENLDIGQIVQEAKGALPPQA